MTFVHKSVLLDEVLALAQPVLAESGSPKVFVDGTLGGAGHSTALLNAFPKAQLIGLDRDPTAIATARERLNGFGARATVVHERFSQTARVLETLNVPQVDFVLVDLGVSSHQIDTAERGFSFRKLGPLDMRMNPSEGESALELIGRLGEDDLANVIYELGEERMSRRVARAIKAATLTSTNDLAEVIRKVVPASRDGIDPATRTFQALRMAVNDELGELATWLAEVPALLREGGVIAAISFHSLEDRMVKNAFRDAAKGCVCPPNVPVCMCNKVPTLDVLTTKPITASEAELRDNARSRSAKLRAAKKVAVLQ